MGQKIEKVEEKKEKEMTDKGEKLKEQEAAKALIQLLSAKLDEILIFTLE